MRSPFAPLYFVFFLFVLILLVVFIQVGALAIAFDKLGLSANSAILLLFSSFFGSAVNLPLFTIQATPQEELFHPAGPGGLLRLPMRPFTGKTMVAANVGGCLIPLGFSLYLTVFHPLPVWQVVVGVAAVAAISYQFSRPIRGVGIGMPIFIAPVSAAVVALLLNPEHSAPLAYISGTLGVLCGADLLRLNDIRKLGVPFASIGGAGTFDGIFITGIVAVLLA